MRWSARGRKSEEREKEAHLAQVFLELLQLCTDGAERDEVEPVAKEARPLELALAAGQPAHAARKDERVVLERCPCRLRRRHVSRELGFAEERGGAEVEKCAGESLGVEAVREEDIREVVVDGGVEALHANSRASLAQAVKYHLLRADDLEKRWGGSRSDEVRQQKKGK